MKIERLAGIQGEPEVGICFAHDWYVCQYGQTPEAAQVYGPTRKSEREAIRAWNAMVRRIRKANAKGKP